MVGRFLSKTGNLKTRKVKKKKIDLAMGRQEREEGEEGKREGRDGF